MTLADSIHAQRLRVVREAGQSGNVSETCRRYGWSRVRFCALRKRFREYWADGIPPLALSDRPFYTNRAHSADRLSLCYVVLVQVVR
jgi:transposase-like protein